MSWASTYVGLPWRERGRDRRGCDCWGLVRLVLAEQRGVALPSFADDYAGTDGRGVAELIEANRGLGTPIASREEQAFDLVHCRMPCAGHGRARLAAWHVGIVVTPDRMLHVTQSLGAAAIEDYRHSPRLRHAVLGFYRV